MPMRPFLVALLVVALTLSIPLSTPAIAADQPHMAGTSAAAASSAPLDYATQVQEIFDRRCIACHGCLGSPCNVKLDSFRGVDRGGYGPNPYSTRLLADPRTDMDAADSTAAWRERGFYPILREPDLAV